MARSHPTRRNAPSSYVRFEAAQPNECWQSDFTHYRLTRPDGRPGADVEIITWLDDHSRYALHVTRAPADHRQIVRDSFRKATAQHGYPAATLTDNGMVYTVRLASRRGGRTALETALQRLGIVQKNSRPNHPHLRNARTADSHDRVRTDKIDKTGCVTLRVAGQLRHIGIGRPHAGTHVTLLIHDLHVRVINAATGELLRELTSTPPATTSHDTPTPQNDNSRTHAHVGSAVADVLRHHTCPRQDSNLRPAD